MIDSSAQRCYEYYIRSTMKTKKHLESHVNAAVYSTELLRIIRRDRKKLTRMRYHACHDNNIRGMIHNHTCNHLSIGNFTGGGHGKSRVIHTFDRFQFSVKLLDDLRLPFRDDDFQAIVMVEVNMLTGKYGVMVIVLNIKETGDQPPMMVIIDQRDSAGYLTVFPPLLPYEFLPDQVPDGLGTIRVLPFVNVFIKTLQKGIFQRYAETGDACHNQPLSLV